MKTLRQIILSAAALLMGLPGLGADATGRPKIYGIAFVKVKATDIEKSKAFYGGVLGLQSGGPACKGVANPCFSINAAQHVELLNRAGR
jgi:hypothetical protein